jgi:hypothetical protein
VEVQQLQQLNTNLNAEHTLELQQIQEQQAEEQNAQKKLFNVKPVQMPSSQYNMW